MRLLERHGFQVQKYDSFGNPIIVGHIGGQSKRTLLFYNHYDVESPEPLELWTTPPFKPAIRGGALYACGAADDKGEFIARLAAIDAVQAIKGGTLPCGVTLVVEGEEEIGSPHLAQFVREHAEILESQAAIWEDGGTDPEGNPRTDLGYRGILCIDLVVETLKMDAHSAAAHIFPNAAWRLLQVLSSLKGEDERILIPGFYEYARQPSKRDFEMLDILPNYDAWAREAFGIKEFVGGLKSKDLNRAVFNSTCNIAGFTAGYQGEGSKTIIPARANAKVDFRIVPDQDPDDIFNKLRTYLDQLGFTDVAVLKLAEIWPYKASVDNPFVLLTKRTAEEVYKRPYLINPIAGESGLAYAIANPLGGIPIISAGVGYANNRIHLSDEHIRLNDFFNGARHIARILDGFAELS